MFKDYQKCSRKRKLNRVAVIGMRLYPFLFSFHMHPFCAGSKNTSSVDMSSHVLKDPAFWDHFERMVRSGAWKCPFTPDLLTKDLTSDAKLYANDTILRMRRTGVSKWLSVNDTSRWADLVLEACREIADGRGGDGPHCRLFRELHMLEALADFVEHLNCFGVVATVMASKGRKVTPFSQDSSRVHDIDKLDPVMLVGYSEKFEDNVSTSVWTECVDRHTLVNPHHQAHPMWHKDMESENCTSHYAKITDMALSEMICDKVSRKLQKELGGVVSDAMWDVDHAYFNGLPRHWLEKADEIISNMKKKPPYFFR